MLSREEMIKLLANEYDIHNDKELDEAIKALNFPYWIFAEPDKRQKTNKEI